MIQDYGRQAHEASLIGLSAARMVVRCNYIDGKQGLFKLSVNFYLNCLQFNFELLNMHSMANANTSKTSSAIDQALMLENQLCFAMYSASLAMTKVYKKILKDLNITYPQYLVMLVLWEKDEVTVSDLGGKLFLDSGTLTPLLKRMETMGLLHRSRDVEDERRVVVKLSGEGRALRKRAAMVPEKLVCALPPLDQVSNLREELKVLRKGLLEEAENP